MLPAPTFPYSGQVALSHHCCPSSMTHHLQREMIHRVAVHGLRIHSGYFTAYGYSTQPSTKSFSRFTTYPSASTPPTPTTLAFATAVDGECPTSRTLAVWIWVISAPVS